MNTFKGTPGPLKIDLNTITKVHSLDTIEVSTGKKWIAYVRGDTNEEAVATAKLFAASPKLMEALQEMVEYWDWAIGDPHFEAYKKAKAALSAALD